MKPNDALPRIFTTDSKPRITLHGFDYEEWNKYCALQWHSFLAYPGSCSGHSGAGGHLGLDISEVRSFIFQVSFVRWKLRNPFPHRSRDENVRPKHTIEHHTPIFVSKVSLLGHLSIGWYLLFCCFLVIWTWIYLVVQSPRTAAYKLSNRNVALRTGQAARSRAKV